MSTATLDVVQQSIRDAFRGVPNPTQERRAHCSRCSDEIDVQRLEFVARWDEIPPETLFNMSLASFSPEGFRFALPALMLHALDQPDSTGLEVNNVIWGLAPSAVWDPGKVEDPVDRRPCFASLDGPQRAAVIAFLTAMANMSPADELTREDAAKALAWWVRTDDPSPAAGP
jgi:hypothetical protein